MKVQIIKNPRALISHTVSVMPKPTEKEVYEHWEKEREKRQRIEILIAEIIENNK